MKIQVDDFKPDKSKKNCFVVSKRGIDSLKVSNLTTGTLFILSEAFQVEPVYAWSFFLTTVTFAMTPVIFLLLLRKGILERCCKPTPSKEYHKLQHYSDIQITATYTELRKNNFSNYVCKGKCNKYEVISHQDCDLTWKASKNNFKFHYTHKKWYWTAVEVPAMMLHLWDLVIGDLIYLSVANFYCIYFQIAYVIFYLCPYFVFIQMAYKENLP